MRVGVVFNNFLFLSIQSLNQTNYSLLLLSKRVTGSVRKSGFPLIRPSEKIKFHIYLSVEIPHSLCGTNIPVVLWTYFL